MRPWLVTSSSRISNPAAAAPHAAPEKETVRVDRHRLDKLINTIGELVMDGLKQLDDVAYVRFASVYRNFRDPKDFEDVLGELQDSERPKAPGKPS